MLSQELRQLMQTDLWIDLNTLLIQNSLDMKSNKMFTAIDTMPVQPVFNCYITLNSVNSTCNSNSFNRRPQPHHTVFPLLICNIGCPKLILCLTLPAHVGLKKIV